MKIGWRQQEDGPGRERIRRAVESMLPFSGDHITQLVKFMPVQLDSPRMNAVKYLNRRVGL